MNRAWIPAGALASVSVAGLIALGPLTDSLSTKVPFPPPVEVAQPATHVRSFVPVAYSEQGPVGTSKTDTAALSSGRGGQSKVVLTSNPDTGFAGYRKHVTRAQPTTPAAPTVKDKPKKKVVKRQTSIEATGETNGDSGLAGGPNGSTGLGEQTATPGNDAP